MKSKILGLLAVGLLAGPMAAHAVSYFVRENSVGPTLYVDSQTSVSFNDVGRGNVTSGSANLADGSLKAYAEAPSGSQNTANAAVDFGDTLTIIGLTAPTLVTVQIQVTGTNSGTANSTGAFGLLQFGRGFSCNNFTCVITGGAGFGLTQFNFTGPVVSELVSAQILIDPSDPSFTFLTQLVAQTNPGGIADFGSTAKMNLLLPTGLSFTSASGVFLTQGTPPPVGVPEPGTLALLGLGLAGLGLSRRRKA